MIKKSVLLIAASGLFAGGCSTLQPPVRQIAVDSNRVFAESANQQTFLNILRAKDRLPMHFSSFRYFRGNVQVTGSAGLGGSLVERGTQVLTKNLAGTDPTGASTNTGTESTLSNGVDSFTPSLGFSVSSNPNFEVGVFDTKEFQSGILTPVTPSLVEFYLGQGWPQEFVAALFLGGVKFTVKESGSEKQEDFYIPNEPASGTYDFSIFLKNFRMVQQKSPGKDVPVAEFGQFNDKNLRDLPNLDGNKFVVKVATEPDPEKEASEAGADDANPVSVCRTGMSCIYRVGKPSRGISFKFTPTKPAAETVGLGNFPQGELRTKIFGMLSETRAPQVESSASSSPNDVIVSTTEGSSREDSAQGDSDTKSLKEADLYVTCGSLVFSETDDGKSTDEKPTCSIFKGEPANGQEPLASLTMEVNFRSPQSVIYFLGKYAREKNPYELTHKNCAYRIIKIEDKFQAGDALRVRFRGENYSIPKTASKCENGNDFHRSTQAISLVQQLVNLHKTSDTLPGTRAVQIVP